MKYGIETRNPHREHPQWALIDECDTVEAFYRRCGGSDLDYRLVRLVDGEVLIQLWVFDSEDAEAEGFINFNLWGATCSSDSPAGA